MKIFKVLIPLIIAGSLTGIYGCSDDNKQAEPNITPAATNNVLEKRKPIDYKALYIVNGGDSSISVVDIASNELKETIRLDNVPFPHHANINNTKDKIALGVPGMDLSSGHGGGHHGMKGKIVVIDPVTGRIISTKETPEMNHNSIFSPDGKEIWTVAMAEKGKALVYDAVTLNLLKEIPVGKQPAEVTISADGKKAFIANGTSNDISVIDIMTKAVIKTIKVGENPVGAWTGADNKMYVDNEHSKTISVIDVNKLEVEETVNLGFMPGMAALNISKNELWVSDADSGSVVIFKKENAKFIKIVSIPTGKGAHAIAFTKDGKTAYISNQLVDSVSVIDTTNKSVIKSIKVGSKPNGLAIKE